MARKKSFQKAVANELVEHPWISRAQAARLVKDHNRAKRVPKKMTTTRRIRNVLRKALGLSGRRKK
ncbi:hypothetical protein M0R72_06180 [Candidatus Pacearchaeota archaeon]|nr:hypothetical protein [Candidatus Pacearchaeota archaeon]